MAIYIALLRGINVGGKNKIKMAELRKLLEAMGLKKVQTYIQSGNVLFESNEKDELLSKKIEQKIEEDFGFTINVILRTAADLEQIIGNLPFSEQEISQAESSSVGESLYVALLTEAPSQEGIDLIKTYVSESEECKIEGREFYLLFHHSIRNSKLATKLQKLGVPVTIRNWKTMKKLEQMVKSY